jgi:hypothetical protein
MPQQSETGNVKAEPTMEHSKDFNQAMLNYLLMKGDDEIRELTEATSPRF